MFVIDTTFTFVSYSYIVLPRLVDQLCFVLDFLFWMSLEVSFLGMTTILNIPLPFFKGMHDFTYSSSSNDSLLLLKTTK